VPTLTENLEKNFPFLTCIRCNDIEIVGIIINSNDSIVSIYDLAGIRSQEAQTYFLEMGSTWWWESNRRIPISIFLKNEMTSFRPYIKTFNSKDVEFVFGPVVRLNDISEKRVKRKSIQLVRSVKKTPN
jgi:hypothetical protein